MSFFLRIVYKHYIQIILGMCASFIFFVPLMEVIDTNDYNLLTKDPTTGLFLYKKNSSFNTSGDCYENSVSVNNLGLHGPPVTIEKGKNVFRILVIGSSYAAALQVPVRDMYSTVLEKKLNSDPHKKYTYEVIPLALNQNGTFLNTLYYINYGVSLSPDLVIDLETQYELIEKLDNPPVDANGNILLLPPKYRENSKTAFVRAASRHTKLLVNLYNRFLVLNDAIHAFVKKPLGNTLTPEATTPVAKNNDTSVESERWKIKEKLVSTLAKAVMSHGSQFLFASWTGSQTSPSVAAELPRHMQELAVQYDFSYANLVPNYLAEVHTAGIPGVLACDIHWDTSGNQYIADSLYKYLMQNPNLLSR